MYFAVIRDRKYSLLFVCLSLSVVQDPRPQFQHCACGNGHSPYRHYRSLEQVLPVLFFAVQMKCVFYEVETERLNALVLSGNIRL
jgi:acetone carboxylase gamma subunit